MAKKIVSIRCVTEHRIIEKPKRGRGEGKGSFFRKMPKIVRE